MLHRRSDVLRCSQLKPTLPMLLLGSAPIANTDASVCPCLMVIQQQLTGSSAKRRAQGLSFPLLTPTSRFLVTSTWLETWAARALLQTIKSQSVCRVMVIPRSSWEGLARSFGREARAVLCNLQSHVEQMSELESERFCIPVSLPSVSWLTHVESKTLGESDAGSG